MVDDCRESQQQEEQQQDEQQEEQQQQCDPFFEKNEHTVLNSPVDPTRKPVSRRGTNSNFKP